MSNCPCGSGLDYDNCCGPIIAGTTPAPTAEALMRSRYSAYVKREYAHLRDTLSEEQREDYSEENTREWAESAEWLGLTILQTQGGGPEDDFGIVEFVARFRAGGREQKHLEAATFGKIDGRWYYTGQTRLLGKTVTRETPKVGRNDPCPCGSGKKYKRCCGAA